MQSRQYLCRNEPIPSSTNSEPTPSWAPHLRQRLGILASGSLLLQKAQAHRFESLQARAGVSEFAGLGIDFVDGDVVAVLHRGDQPFAAGIDDEVARGFAFD